MEDEKFLPISLLAICRKKVSVAFDGGLLSSNGGVLVLRDVERRLGLAELLAGCLKDRRDPSRTEHELVEMLRLRMFLIAAGYEDADDCDNLRSDPVFKMAVGRLPESGNALCSQPTMSRLENAPSKIEIARMMAAMVDLFCASWARPPAAITLDIDDTLDRVHGGQQLSLFNAYYDERCFLPIHIYEGGSGKPVAVILREGKTPGGAEVRAVIRHVTRHIRRIWPKTRICWRGDSHYARPEAMDWCEENDVDYVFGLAGNDVLHAQIRIVADDLCVRRAETGEGKLRTGTEFRYAAKSWTQPRRVVARLEATTQGFDARYIVTTLEGSPGHLYETVYCARGQAENFIKLHKTQLASDRTSCRSPRANQFRVILHTAAYWLLHTMRAAAPKRSAWRTAEFTNLRLRLIKIAARVVEHTARIRVWLPTASPDAAIFRLLAGRFAAAGP
jgi:hypothetical protein